MTSGETMDVIVARRSEAAEGIIVLDLVAESGVTLPGFEPGAHVDLHIGPGLIRQYSLCGDPSDRSRYQLGVLLAPDSRGGSAAVHRSVHARDRLRLGLPPNKFPLAPPAARTGLICAGIAPTTPLSTTHHCAPHSTPFSPRY